MTLPEVTPLLDGICASAGFRRSPRLQRFLRYVTEQAVRDPRQPLKEFQVATAVFDKPEDFEPQLDPIVRVEAGRLRLRLLGCARWSLAGQRAQELSQRSPLPTASLGHAYARAGSTWEATRILHELKADSSRYVPPFALALIQAGFRKKDATFEELRRAFEEHSPLLGLWLTVEPRLEFLRLDPRFRDLVTKMRLPSKRAASQ